jgi:hypothetical protein
MVPLVARRGGGSFIAVPLFGVERAVASVAGTPRRALELRCRCAEPCEARILDRASEAARFDVVAQLAKELEARRLARSPKVVALRVERRR